MPPTLEQLRRRADQSYKDALAHPELIRGPAVYGVAFNAEIAAQVAQADLWEDIDAAASVATTEAFQAGQDDGLGVFIGGKPPKAAQYATFDGPNDSRTCDLCRFLLGQTVKVSSVEYDQYHPPLHIKERHYYRYHAEAPPGAKAFAPPPEALVKRNGHFVTNPEKYKPLKIPAGPSGRDFIFRRFKDPQTGEWRGSVEYLVHPERPLSRAAKDALVALDKESLTVPAEAWEQVSAGTGPVAELDRAGYVRIVKAQGDPKTLTVTRETAGEVEAYLKQQYPGATVQSVTDAGTLDVGGKPLRQWRASFTEPEARKVTLNKWGKLAAAVEAERLAGAEAQSTGGTE